MKDPKHLNKKADLQLLKVVFLFLISLLARVKCLVLNIVENHE